MPYFMAILDISVDFSVPFCHTFFSFSKIRVFIHMDILVIGFNMLHWYLMTSDQNILLFSALVTCPNHSGVY